MKIYIQIQQPSRKYQHVRVSLHQFIPLNNTERNINRDLSLFALNYSSIQKKTVKPAKQEGQQGAGKVKPFVAVVITVIDFTTSKCGK
jgi:hypothetical protein